MTALDDTLAAVAAALRRRGAMMATAESCTGGLVAAACTSLVGSSEWFERGFVTYSNAAKVELLGVPPTLIEAHGAVSEQVARAMADGALARSPAGYAVAITGVAGPGGGTPTKPVGTVWLAASRRGGSTRSVLLQADGDRAAVRTRSVQRAFELLLETVDTTPG